MIERFSWPEYYAWRSMKQRCYNPNSLSYQYYGARGIRVCQEWIHDFWAFYNHIGPKPNDGFRWSLDRIDNDGHYEPGNVRWADDSTQMLNRPTGDKRHNFKLTWDDVREIRTLKGKASYEDIGQDYGVSRSCIHHIMVGHTWKEEASH